MHNSRWVERAKNVLIALLAVILLVQVVVVLCTSRYMKRMGGGK